MNTRFVRQTSRQMTTIVASLAIAASLVTSQASQQPPYPSGASKRPLPIAIEEDDNPIPEAMAGLLDTASSLHGSIDTLTYEQSYEGRSTTSRPSCMCPTPHSPARPMNILYLTHGWWGNAAGLAAGVAPVVDKLEASGEVSPTIVVFATYYPDRSFATDDYEEDYALNRFSRRPRSIL